MTTTQNTKGHGMKNDQGAREVLTDAGYESAPKSVFGTLAYYLALRVAGEDQGREGALRVLTEEWDALHAAGIIPQKPRTFQL